jgi:hypothetical protein
MKVLDLSDNPRIPLLMKMMQSIEGFSDPHDLLESFVDGMRKAFGSRCYMQLGTRGAGWRTTTQS